MRCFSQRHTRRQQYMLIVSRSVKNCGPQMRAGGHGPLAPPGRAVSCQPCSTQFAESSGCVGEPRLRRHERREGTGTQGVEVRGGFGGFCRDRRVEGAQRLHDRAGEIFVKKRYSPPVDTAASVAPGAGSSDRASASPSRYGAENTCVSWRTPPARFGRGGRDIRDRITVRGGLDQAAAVTAEHIERGQQRPVLFGGETISQARPSGSRIRPRPGS